MQPEALVAALTASGHSFARLSVKSSSGKVTTGKELDTLLDAPVWRGAAGWIARQSGVILLPGTDDPALGSVLEAELGTDTATLQIRRLEGTWVWTRFDEVAGGDMLADDILLVTTHAKAACYRRYWRLPDDGAAEIVACRLVGLKEIAQ